MNRYKILSQSRAHALFTFGIFLGLFSMPAGLGGAQTAQISSPQIPAPAVQNYVIDLKFNEFFRRPVGPAGLELTSRIQSLHGRRVRISGFIVRQANPSPGAFLLAALPLQLHDEHYGLADDLPGATLFVSGPAEATARLRRSTGPVLVTGKLEIGNHQEPDGRISTVRLAMDALSSPPDRTPRSTKGGATELGKARLRDARAPVSK